MKKMIFAALAMLAIGTANADPYVTASVGALTTGGTQAVAVGMDYGNGISAEVEYRNFNSNTTSGNGLVVCDSTVGGKCVASHGESDVMSVRMNGIGATAKLKVTENMYARVGAFYHNATVDETFAASRNLAPTSFTDSGFSPVIGMGVTYHGFALEVTSFGAIAPTPEGKALAVGTSASYTYKF